MSSLHYTLIALGIGLVGAVMLFNLFQERRSRKQAERLFHPGERTDRDVSLSGLPEPADLSDSRIEPCILRVSDDVADGMDENEDRMPVVEPEAAPEQVFRESPVPLRAEAREPAALPESPLDARIEFVARLRYAQPATVAVASLQDSLRRISKPIRMLGRREHGVWEPVAGHVSRQYDSIEIGLLLADRNGPVSDVQIDTFCRRLYDFAAEHGGAVTCQDKDEAVERAQALDVFCAGVDMLIGLNIVPPTETGFDAATVYELATQAGMTQGAEGGYAMRDASGQVLFALADGTPGSGQPAQGIALLFDVPRVAHGLDAFDRMTAMAVEMAERLDTRLVDDGGRAVSQASLQRDRQALEQIYARMAEQGIPAGGERALRLFA